MWLSVALCNAQLHLLYLGRYFHWVLSVLTCGGCCVGTLCCDRIGLGAYVAEANVDDDFIVYAVPNEDVGLKKSSSSPFFKASALTAKLTYGILCGAFVAVSAAQAGWNCEFSRWGDVDHPPAGALALARSALASLVAVTMLLRVGPRTTTRASLLFATALGVVAAISVGRILDADRAAFELIPITILLCCRTRTWTSAELGRMRRGEAPPASFGSGERHGARGRAKCALAAAHLLFFLVLNVAALMRAGYSEVDGQRVPFGEGVRNVLHHAIAEGGLFSSVGRIPTCHAQSAAAAASSGWSGCVAARLFVLARRAQARRSRLRSRRFAHPDLSLATPVFVLCEHVCLFVTWNIGTLLLLLLLLFSSVATTTHSPSASRRNSMSRVTTPPSASCVPSACSA